ncbi:MAG: aspartate/glutamate racemase family protein [Phycisphaerales bacterium JB040]
MRTIGIAAHSAEGGTLCFLTACHEGATHLGEHMHPTIVASCVPMGLAMPGWEAGDYDRVAPHLARGVELVAKAGADFYVCPDNTAHLVLERIAGELPLPGLHIAEVVVGAIRSRGWSRAGLLGTRWTMTGAVYERALSGAGIERVIPDEPEREALNAAIFDELCRGEFREETAGLFLRAIEGLERRGAECVILGCTEIPLIVTPENSALPVLDSTRLLACEAVRVALEEGALPRSGWIGA